MSADARAEPDVAPWRDREQRAREQHRARLLRRALRTRREAAFPWTHGMVKRCRDTIRYLERRWP